MGVKDENKKEYNEWCKNKTKNKIKISEESKKKTKMLQCKKIY